MSVTRRELLQGLAGTAALGWLGCGTDAPPPAKTARAPLDCRPGQMKIAPTAGQCPAPRGVVITAPDLSWTSWIDRAVAAGLTTIALHTNEPNGVMVPFIGSYSGQAFLDSCAAHGLLVEYEMHAVPDLLPRSLFATNPSLFRSDEKCQRVGNGNLCVHNPDALAIAADNAIALCRTLRSTPDRYFLWPADDEGQWCQCACCSPLGASDQLLILENHLIAALQSEFPNASLAHLAYTNTITAPVTVKPAPGIFLEFCPYWRRYDIPFNTPSDKTQASHLAAMDANLAVFGTAGAQALEFWLDASRISGTDPPNRPLSFSEELVMSDVLTYHQRGIENITSFAVYLDSSYVAMYGEPPIANYGAALRVTGRPSRMNP